MSNFSGKAVTAELQAGSNGEYLVTPGDAAVPDVVLTVLSHPLSANSMANTGIDVSKNPVLMIIEVSAIPDRSYYREGVESTCTEWS